MRNEMTINEIITRIGSIRESISKEDADACATAISVLAALVNEGCIDFEGVLDILQDYRSLAKQYQTMHKRFEVEGKPIYRDGAWNCPACNRCTRPRHSFCHCCGKKLVWG